MSEEDGLIWAYQIDPNGRASELDWQGLDERSNEGVQWIHLDLGASDASIWLLERSGLPEIAIDALTANETRPRALPVDDALVLILRGVNLNPGADPEDMVSIRLWADQSRVISIRRRRLLALSDLQSAIERGRGPKSSDELVAALADGLVDRMSSVLTGLDEGLDAIEEGSGGVPSQQARTDLLELRRQAIGLRRYLAPQRDALQRLANERLPWVSDSARGQLREVLDRTTRYVEDLEAARERAAVAQEEIASRLAEQLNTRMYALSIVAGIFLPLSFATGLLGINVGGIPGTDSPTAFAAVCGGLVLLGIAEVALFRRLGWL